MAASTGVENSAYTYKPLDHSKDEIRLIRFQSRERHLQQVFTPPLELSLKHASLAERPTYHALSYVWGSSIKTDTILVDGQIIHITRSLYEALMWLNFEEGVEWLWADALCINQEDNDEKSVQVKKMRRIFTSAVKVLAFLGTPPSGRELLIEEVARQGKALIMEHSWGSFPGDRQGYNDPDDMPTSRFWQMFHLIAEKSHHDMTFLTLVATRLGIGSQDGGVFPHREMLNFLRHRIWSRVWILQEFICAKDLILVCGLSELKFIYFVIIHWIYLQFYEWKRHPMDLGPRAAEYVQVLATMAPYTFNTIRTMQAMHRWGHMDIIRQNSFRLLSDILPESFRLKASDPRDKIFALLDISKDATALGLSPDYSKEYSEVLIETAWRLMSRGMSALNYALGLRESSLAPGLPTWVPEWSLRTVATLDDASMAASVRFLASGMTKMKIDTPLEESDYARRTLQISGRLVALVVGTGEAVSFPAPRETPQNVRLAQRFLQDLEDLALSSCSDWPGAGSYVSEALWKVPIAHRRVINRELIGSNLPVQNQGFPGTQLQQHIQEAAKLEKEFSRLSGKDLSPEPLSPPQSISWLLLNCATYLEVIYRVADEKRPMICSGSLKDYLGMGPRETEAGDSVCIFEGSHVPIILRPREDGCFQVVGEAYIYGMMYGEMLKDDSGFEMVILV
jgi:hypothetical protein